MSEPLVFRSFQEFYAFYLSQHANPVCKGLHIAGVLSALTLGVVMIVSGHWFGLAWMPVVGYACSWTGHFVFEKNRPATFGYPFYSLMGDFLMTAQSLGLARKTAVAPVRPA